MGEKQEGGYCDVSQCCDNYCSALDGGNVAAPTQPDCCTILPATTGYGDPLRPTNYTGSGKWNFQCVSLWRNIEQFDNPNLEIPPIKCVPQGTIISLT